eukprot:scaffold5170_cov200-Alexandrium_tamarense.AAC.6
MLKLLDRSSLVTKNAVSRSMYGYLCSAGVGYSVDTMAVYRQRVERVGTRGMTHRPSFGIGGSLRLYRNWHSA